MSCDTMNGTNVVFALWNLSECQCLLSGGCLTWRVLTLWAGAGLEYTYEMSIMQWMALNMQCVTYWTDK